jgi:hypothetical protein
MLGAKRIPQHFAHDRGRTWYLLNPWSPGGHLHHPAPTPEPIPGEPEPGMNHYREVERAR